MPTNPPIPPLLSLDEVAEQLGTTVRHLRRLVAERRIPYIKVGWFIRFDPTEIAVWLDQHRVRSTRSA